MRLENKVALITGGYGGMGRASARLFAHEGATVFVAGRNHKRGEALVAEINDAGGGTAHFVELDVVNQDQWDAAIEQIKQHAGGLHVLMNIVGSNALVRFPEVDVDELRTIFDINVTATVYCGRGSARPPRSATRICGWPERRRRAPAGEPLLYRLGPTVPARVPMSSWAVVSGCSGGAAALRFECGRRTGRWRPVAER